MGWGPMDEFRWSQIVSVLLPKMFTYFVDKPGLSKNIIQSHTEDWDDSFQPENVWSLPCPLLIFSPIGWRKVKQPFNSLLLEPASNCAAEITILRGYLQKWCLRHEVTILLGTMMIHPLSRDGQILYDRRKCLYTQLLTFKDKYRPTRMNVNQSGHPTW